MSDKYHVLPVNDLKPHIESGACACRPSVQEEGRLVVHNAWDGREFQEDRARCFYCADDAPFAVGGRKVCARHVKEKSASPFAAL